MSELENSLCDIFFYIHLFLTKVEGITSTVYLDLPFASDHNKSMVQIPM